MNAPSGSTRDATVRRQVVGIKTGNQGIELNIVKIEPFPQHSRRGEVDEADDVELWVEVVVVGHARARVIAQADVFRDNHVGVIGRRRCRHAHHARVERLGWRVGHLEDDRLVDHLKPVVRFKCELIGADDVGEGCS